MAVESCSCSFTVAALYPSSRHHHRRFAPLGSLRPPPATGGKFLATTTRELRASSWGVVSGRRRSRRGSPISAVFERFTERAVKVVVLSQRQALAFGCDVVQPHHLLLGLVAEEPSPVGFLGSGIRFEEAHLAVAKVWPEEQKATPHPSSAADLPFSVGSKKALDTAVELSKNMGCNFISPEHIALGLLTSDNDGAAAHVLRSLGADLNRLASVALARIQGEMAKDGRDSAALSSFKLQGKSPARKPAIEKFSDRKKEKSVLSQFCVDLTMRASQGLIDPVIGRDKEVQRVVQIICRRTKNNPILLGEPGVGKTAIAEGLALRIANGEVPIFLVAKRIMSLDVGLLMAGAKERGEIESRVTGLISEVKESDDVILFIDEVHNLIGSGTVGKGSKGSGLDIANLLKPALARGELQCIASTTLDEHRAHFEKDKALARRFQPVFIDEPTPEDAVKILLGLCEKYEAYHKCKYTLEAIHSAVYLSARYIPDRNLPDKAIDLIDEAGSRAHMDAYKRRKEDQSAILTKSPDEYWQEIRTVQAMHEVVLANKRKYNQNQGGNYASDASDQQGESKRTSASISPLTHDEVVVGVEEIARVASLWSGVPVQQLTVDERKQLAGLDEELQRRVIGQDDAVGAISRAVKRSRVGLSDPNRPIATMLFCGPTGVGKTELTKALAASYFGSESAMLRLDMSEYMERHTVSKLIGSPPGYVGYGEGGTLTEAVRRKPFTVVLLDEIEKAHPDIFNILLQIFEDGHLTDSQGRKVSFKNTLIVMTSNIGSSSISKGRQSIGFLLSEDKESRSYAAMKSIVMEELRAYFRPELLNRIDEVVVFHPLERTQMMAILHIILQELKDRIAGLGVGLEVSDAMKELLCEEGYDKSYGARPLRRAVTRLIEDVVSEAILSGEVKPGDRVLIDADDSGAPSVSQFVQRAVELSDATQTL